MNNFLYEYIESIKNISTDDKEHTYRSALEKLLNDTKNLINKNIRIKHEPNNDKNGAGAPDFLISFDDLIVGYIENKRVNDNLDNVIKSEQIIKYLTLSDNIIVTDYLKFCLIDKNANIIQEVRLCELSELKQIKKINIDEDRFLELFNIFFSREPKNINNSLEFAKALAMRTRILKDYLEEKEDNSQINELYNIFKNTIYSQIKFDEFCDNFAQTLTYSLFLAKLNSDSKIDLYNVSKFIPKSFSLIRAISRFLSNLEDLNKEDLIGIKWLLEEILNIISHINVESIIEELNKYSNNNILEKDPYIHFYETFLSKYNPDIRDRRGVYYTPNSVVNFIINSIDIVLKRDFDKANGLGDSINKNSNITLLDFATGTGTFLDESFRKALSYYDKSSTKFNPKELINKFFGFEFLIAPYTIAHLKLSQTLKEEFDYILDDDERLNIFLTNTLEDIHLNKESHNYFTALVDETKLAEQTKEKNILVITGNPPYSGASANKGIFEEEVKKEYKDNLEILPLAITRNGKIEKEKNPKWLLDDYVKFIRFSQQKIDNNYDGGIFAFISNNGFLDNPTFRGMRYSLLKSFDKIYIINLHGDTRKKEICPDGSKDENVFDIMQGVSINIFIKYDKKHKDKRLVNLNLSPKNHKYGSEIATTYYYDLWGKRDYKYNFLLSNSLESIDWQELNFTAPFFLFIHQNENIKEEYDSYYSVKDIFLVSGVGICSKRDNIVFHNTKESLIKLLNDFITKPKEELYKLYDIGKDSGGWKLDWAIKAIKENKNNLNDYIMKCHYRPFDFKYTYYVKKNCGFMARPVYDIFENLLQEDENIGLICYRGTKLKDISNIFITDTLIDLHIVGEGSSIFSLYLYDMPSVRKMINNQNDDKEQPLFKQTIENPFENKNKIENLTQNFRNFIDKKYNHHFSPEEILGYIYAILFSKTYRKKYIDFLKIDFPRIPFTDDIEKFKMLSKLGQELYNLHLMKEDNLQIDNGRYLNEKNNKIKKPIYIENENKIFVNDTLHFIDINKDVWEYKIGGYKVLDKYIKSHKDEELDIEHFQKIITIINKTIKIEKEIEDIIFL